MSATTKMADVRHEREGDGMGSVIVLYAAAAPADGIAQIDIPVDAKIVGVNWGVRVASAGADFNQAYQVSFSSTGQFAANDTRSVISLCRHSCEFTTSGVVVESFNHYDAIPGVPVSAGERLFLHATGTAVTATIDCALHLDVELDKPPTRRR